MLRISVVLAEAILNLLKAMIQQKLLSLMEMQVSQTTLLENIQLEIQIMLL